MASHSDTAQRWAEQVGTEHPRYLKGHNVWERGDRLYSYGTHFELARLVGARKSGFFLLNGDRYSKTTSHHQSEVRRAVTATGIPYAIVPYTALAAAGIELDSIRPLEVQPDRTDRWTEDIGEAWTLDDPRARCEDDSSHESEYPFPSYLGGLPGRVTRKWRLPGSSVHAVELLRGYSNEAGEYVNYSPGEHVDYYTAGGSHVQVIGGRFHAERSRHFLGAFLFTAKVAGSKRRRKFLSAFDDAERVPLYFLCELPRGNARTYDQAIDALAPRIVHAALAQGREVTRQGDVFAIPTTLDRATLRKRGARFSKRGKLVGTDHAASEVAKIGRATYARGCLYHDVGAWRIRDHARRKMADGKTWHLIARNTVPRASARVAAGRAL